MCAYGMQYIPRSNYNSPTSKKTNEEYIEDEVDNLITEMHELVDWSDEEIFDEVVEWAGDSLSNFEKNLLAEKLGAN